MLKAQFLSRFLALALILSGCSIEINQTMQMTPVPSLKSTSVSPSTSALPATQVPITWSGLGLTGKLIYISGAAEGTESTTKVQMLDLVTGNVATIFSVNGAWIYYASVSPDARRLVMSYSPPSGPGSASSRLLYILSLDGTAAPRPLFTPPTPDDRYTQVEWSPDGQSIYYAHYNHSESGGKFYEVYQIFRMKYPTGSSEKILDKAFWPRVSADSTRLVYVSLDPDSGNNELWLADEDGSHPRKITLTGSPPLDIIDAPIFSPDGGSILFSAPTPGQSYQMGARSSLAHPLPASPTSRTGSSD